MQPLPIDQHLPAIIAALTAHSCAVLRAETGAGKTTRVPPSLFDAGLAADKQIVLLQPRRLAARAAAARISQERGTKLGDETGYEVRFDRRTSRATRILAVTDGVFIRMLQSDPLLERVGIVIFDEFHERSLNSDLALAMVRRVQTEVRPDLKILVMSATLAAEPIARYLDNCPTIDSPGRLFPIDIQYRSDDSNQPIHLHAAIAVEELLARDSGDLLVFLPGVGEIRRTSDQLTDIAAEQNLTILQLFGDMSLEQQQTVLAPSSRRKIVLATNVAQTSLTIEGVTAVVDTGLARVLRRDPNLGLNRLEIERISRASADQRAGRAGRTAPGICLRLWSAAQHRHFAEHDEPEIHRVDLAGAVLELLAWGENDPLALPWFEPPSTTAIEQALSLLQILGATDNKRITPLGAAMARLPVHPRIARLILEAARLGHAAEATLAGALLSERDIFANFAKSALRNQSRRTLRHGSDSDVLDRVAALTEFEQTGRRDFDLGQLDVPAAKLIFRSRDQLLRSLPPTIEKAENTEENEADEAILRAIATAYSDRLARRREPDSRRGLMLGGRGVRLSDISAVTQSELFVCVELEESGSSEALVRIASAVQPNWLPAATLNTKTDVEFDAVRQRVTAWRRTYFHDLIIDQSVTNIPPDVDTGAILRAKPPPASIYRHCSTTTRNNSSFAFNASRSGCRSSKCPHSTPISSRACFPKSAPD